MTDLDQTLPGKPVECLTQYDAKLLFPLKRETIPGCPPFTGFDIWNAYELSWLNLKGKPEIALARFYFPANSPFLLESKSLKLYLSAFSNTQLACAADLQTILEKDLSAATQAQTKVQLIHQDQIEQQQIEPLQGILLDHLDIETKIYQPDPCLLSANHHHPSPITLIGQVYKFTM